MHEAGRDENGREQTRPRAERTEQGKEGVEIFYDQAMVLNSRNLRERVFLVKRNIIYARAHGIGSTRHVSTYD
jgi:hypothetical protein